jgi:hypothetical protein
MRKNKRRKIEERLRNVEVDLANAQDYVEKSENIESSSFLHFSDWRGKSGHPAWMKNHMIPTLIKYRARKEKTLQKLRNQAKDKRVTNRKRQGWTEAAEKMHRAGEDQLLIPDVFVDDIEVERWSS